MSSIKRTIEISFRHRVYFTRDVFGPGNPLLKEVLADRDSGMVPKVLVVVDESLNTAQPGLSKKIESYLADQSRFLLVCPPMILEGGERAKNSYFHVSDIQSHIDRYHI